MSNPVFVAVDTPDVALRELEAFVELELLAD